MRVRVRYCNQRQLVTIYIAVVNHWDKFDVKV